MGAILALAWISTSTNLPNTAADFRAVAYADMRSE